MKEIDNKCTGSNEFTWYDTDGCNFTAKPTEDGKVRINLKCRSTECIHSEVSVVIGFDEYSMIGIRAMWADELKEIAFSRRNCDEPQTIS